MGPARTRRDGDEGRTAVPPHRGGCSLMADPHRRPAAPDPLPHPVVDNHCHLDIDGGESESLSPRAAIESAAAVGVPRIVQIGCDLHSARWTSEIIEEYPGLIGGVALHPNETPHLVENDKLDDALHAIEEIVTSSDLMRAVGETGLDYYRTGEAGRAAQHESFRAHIDMAKRLDKTLVIHDRDRSEEHTSELQSRGQLVCRLLLEKKNTNSYPS